MATACETIEPFPLTRLALECELVTDFGRLEALSASWQQLWTASPRSEVFQRFEWIRSWWQGYGASVNLCTVAVFRDRALIGILPLVRRGANLEFLGYPCTDYNDLICAESDARDVTYAVMQAIASFPFRWRQCKLENVPENSRLLRYWAEIDQSLPLLSLRRPGSECPTILLHDRRTEVLTPLLRKHHYRRHENKLERQGKVSFRHIVDTAELQQHLPRFIAQQIERRTLKRRRSLFCSPEFCRYCEALFKNFDPASELRFSVLELDGEPIAYHLGFQVNGKFLMYQQSFDINAENLAPGDVLLLKLLHYAYKQDIVEYDFSRGAARYKSSFTNYIKENSVLWLFPRSGRGYWRAALLQLRQAAAKSQFLRNSWHLFSEKFATVLDRLHRLREHPSQALKSAMAKVVSGIYQCEFAFFVTPTGQMDSNDTKLHCHQGTLSQIAALAGTNLPGFTANDLIKTRDCLRTGCACLLLFDNSQLVDISLATTNVACTGARSLPTAPVITIERLWCSAALSDAAGQVHCMVAISRSLSPEGKMFFCRSDQNLMHAFERSGMRVCQHLRAIRLFGCRIGPSWPSISVPAAPANESFELPVR